MLGIPGHHTATSAMHRRLRKILVDVLSRVGPNTRIVVQGYPFLEGNHDLTLPGGGGRMVKVGKRLTTISKTANALDHDLVAELNTGKLNPPFVFAPTLQIFSGAAAWLPVSQQVHHELFKTKKNPHRWMIQPGWDSTDSNEMYHPNRTGWLYEARGLLHNTSVPKTDLPVPDAFSLQVQADLGAPLDHLLQAKIGVTASAEWRLAPGQALPPGLTLSSQGHVTGTPTSAGIATTVQVRAARNGTISPWVNARLTLTTTGGGGGPGQTTRITNGNSASTFPAISGDGRYITYESYASDLVPGDTNGFKDVFVYDTTTATTTRITNGNSNSRFPKISGDGRYITYYSHATKLVPGDSDPTLIADVFVYDTATAATTRITDGNGGSYYPAISGDGRYITYLSSATDLVPGDTNGYGDVFVYDTTTATTTRITNDNSDSYYPAISGDGRYITYESYATNLVPGDTDPNWIADVFVYDTATATTTRITDGNAGSQDPVISGDGRYIAYHSDASDLLPGDTNGWVDVFVFDTATATTTRITNGAFNNPPAISGDGRYITYSAGANGLADVFVYDTATASTTRITNGNAWSVFPAISADGRYISYHSRAPDLLPGDGFGPYDVFVYQQP